jgi:hypothetical protein
MSITASQAMAAVRARLAAGTYSFSLYYHGDDAPILPDTPATFGFVVFSNEGSRLAAFGGGRGNNLYRNSARVEVFVFSPIGYGLEAVLDHAETVAGQLRSFRDSSISCFAADVMPLGPGSDNAVPGLSRSEVSNYSCALVEATLSFDQIG